MKRKGFSSYDIEEFLKDAGGEDINEKAVFCLKRELEEITNELIESARAYANYAGRKKVIKRSDLLLAETSSSTIIVARRKHTHPKHIKKLKLRGRVKV